MVEHGVEDHAHPALVALGDEFAQHAHVAEVFIDRVVINDVVLVVAGAH